MMADVAAIPQALADLVGETVLEMVPKTDIRHPVDPDASGAMFTLGGRTYLVFENPSDGYRSSASPLMSFKGSADEIGGEGFYPVYLREAVLCSHRKKGEYGDEDDVLEVRSKETGGLIFEVGTHSIDDYYPGYVCRWMPENLSANAAERLRSV